MTAAEHPKQDRSGQRFKLLRVREEGTDVSALELFFDLVYVFAVSQISHLLLEHLTWRGALESAIVTLAVWWAWIDTTWITNWFDPRKMPIRVMLVVLMLLSLVMSAAIPLAFGERGLWFALAYVGIQVGRSVFCWFVLGSNAQSRNFARISAWAILSAPLWIAGGLSEGDTRLWLWIAAVLLDCIAPAMGFRVPGLGKSTTDTWDISGGHLAERAQLFVIICLGESVLLTGAALAHVEHVATEVWLAFGAAFLISVMMWWVYFSRAGRAAELFENAASPGALGRAYTYFHIPMIAGIITMAVANEKVIAHPTGHVEPEFTAVVIGGALLYMFGSAIFNATITGTLPYARVSAILLLLLLIVPAHLVSPLALMYMVLAVFIAVAVYDAVSLPPRHGEDGDEEVQLTRG